MKKTVFLLLFLCFSVGAKNLGASSVETYQFDGYQIKLTYYGENNSRGYHLDKIGESPFSLEIMETLADVKITNVKEIEGNHVLYGYYLANDRATLYDGYLLVLDAQGNEVYKEITDFGLLEEIRDIGILDNVLFIHYRQSDLNENDDPIFYTNILVTMDLQYNVLDSETNDYEFKETEFTDELFLYNLDYGSWDGGFTSDLDLILASDHLDIESNTKYVDSVKVLFVNEALLNGNKVFNGVTIDYPGNYELRYNNFTYVFQVVPLVTGFEDGATYKDSVTPVISSGNVYLNNDLFISGTTINNPGDYTLTILGNNNFYVEYTFTITSSVEGIMNNQTYEDNVEVEFNGEGYLNNVFIESPYEVEEPGEYILKIQGEDNYQETYYFSIEEPEEETNIISFIQKYDVVFLGIVVIGGGLVLKKK